MFGQQTSSISSQKKPSFKHPLLLTAIGVIIGSAIIFFIISLVYNSGNHISNCKNPQIYPMYYANGTFDKNTYVSLCYQKEQLFVEWQINDSEIISQYQNCHDPIYLGDSVGLMFISPLHRYVNNYYSFIVSPNGLVYSQDFSPYYKTHTHIFDCDQVKANIKRTLKGWQAQIQIPIKKIGRGSVFATQIVNFFRIDLNSKQEKSISFNDKHMLQAIQKYTVQENIQTEQKVMTKLILYES